jgi:superfamily II DNA or RNA helicase
LRADSAQAGETSHQERELYLNQFREAKDGRVILLSSVGDHSIDLPIADVVIQVAVINGSRMQEAQRVGRVQRIFPGKVSAKFFSLVSAHEEDFAARRREFMEEHGYRYEMLDHEPFLSQETQGRVAPQVQQFILDAIRKEVGERAQREDEKQTGKAERRSAPVARVKRTGATGADVLQRLNKKIRVRE